MLVAWEKKGGGGVYEGWWCRRWEGKGERMVEWGGEGEVRKWQGGVEK